MDEDDVAKYPGLRKRRGSENWYVQKKVPVDLRHVDQRGSVWRTLDTADLTEAKRLYPVVLAEIVRGFEQKRADLGHNDKVTQALLVAKLEQLSRSEIDSLVWSWWEKRSGARRPDVDDYDLRDTLQSIEDDLRDLAAPGPEEGDPAERLADQLLVEAGMAAYSRKVGSIVTVAKSPAVNRNTDEYRYLTGRVRVALEIEAKLARDYLTGERTVACPRGVIQFQC